MEHSGIGGFMGSKVKTFTTTDPFDKVLDFYTYALGKYETGLISHTSELGRQTAISISDKNKMVSVAVQEVTKEGRVHITFMETGL